MLCNRAARGAVLCICFILLRAGLPAFAAGNETALQRGEKFLLNGDLRQACLFLEQAIRENPGSARALSDLGRTYFHLGRYPDAERCLKAALVHDTGEAWVRDWARLYLGRIRLMRGELEDAGYLFQEVLKSTASKAAAQEAQKYASCVRLLGYGCEKLTGRYDAGNCTVMYDPLRISAENCRSVADSVQLAGEEISRLYGITAQPALDIYLYPPGCERDIWEAREILAHSISTEIYLCFDGFLDRGLLIHEMTHSLTARLFDRQAVSPLLSEGLAEYAVALPWDIPLHAWVRGFMDAGMYVPIGRLADDGRFRQVNPVISYSEAGSFVEFLAERYGTQSIRELLKRRFLWDDVYGKSLAELEQEWLTEIRRTALVPPAQEMVRYRISLGTVFHENKYRGELPWVGVSGRVIGDRVVVCAIAPGSPAERSGLKEGDIIQKIGSIAIGRQNSWRLADAVRSKAPGDRLSFVVRRDGKEEIITMSIGTLEQGCGDSNGGKEYLN
jgi:tetratricopeptide (TPR) repeat protein